MSKWILNVTVRRNAILLKMISTGAFNRVKLGKIYVVLYKSHSRRDAKRYLCFHLSPLSDIIRPECIHRALLYGSIFARQ